MEAVCNFKRVSKLHLTVDNGSIVTTNGVLIENIACSWNYIIFVHFTPVLDALQFVPVVKHNSLRGGLFLVEQIWITEPSLWACAVPFRHSPVFMKFASTERTSKDMRHACRNMTPVHVAKWLFLCFVISNFSVSYFPLWGEDTTSVQLHLAAIRAKVYL